MGYRTDIASEAHEQYGDIDGVTSETSEREGCTVVKTTVKTEEAGKTLGKKPGVYVTVELKGLKTGDIDEEDASHVVARELSEMIKDGGVLVAGLGNRRMTPDALGPRTADGVLATRHIQKLLREYVGIEDSRVVSVFSTDVLGRTGIETSEILRGIISEINPSSVIVIDALASMSAQRLGTTVQISDTGIAPGSGVGNRRSEISKDALGVPVIAIGVPTVVDAATIARDLGGGNGNFFADHGFMVTPKEIDMLIDSAAAVVAGAINIALNPTVPSDDILHALA